MSEKRQIEYVRFAVSTILGRQSLPHEYLSLTTRIDERLVNIVWDVSKPYIEVRITGRDYYEAVPLTNIASMRVGKVAQ